MLLAFGKYLPFIGEVWTAIPGLNVLRYPVKALLVVGLPVAIMAGRGTDRWLKTEERTAVRWWTVVLAMAALSLVIGVWISRGWSAPILDLVFLGRGELAAAGLPGRFVQVALVLGILAVIGFASDQSLGYFRQKVGVDIGHLDTMILLGLDNIDIAFIA